MAAYVEHSTQAAMPGLLASHRLLDELAYKLEPRRRGRHVPTRLPDRRVPTRRAHASRRQRAQTTMRVAGPHVEHPIAVRHGGTSGYLSLGAAFLNGTPSRR